MKANVGWPWSSGPEAEWKTAPWSDESDCAFPSNHISIIFCLSVREGSIALSELGVSSCHGVSVSPGWKMKREVSGRFGAALTVMWLFQRTFMVIYHLIYDPTLACGQELWVVMKRMRSQIQAVSVSFLMGRRQGRVEDPAATATCTLEILYVNHGRRVLQAKVERNCLARYLCTVQKPASVVVRGCKSWLTCTFV